MENPKECNHVSVPIADTQPIGENCMNGLIPECVEQGETKTVIVPEVTSMTKYLFDHYRLTMYSYLNQCLRNGSLQRKTGFSISNRVINRSACTFTSVTYWRIDRLQFWADVKVELTLDTKHGLRYWTGFLTLWFEAGEDVLFHCSVEDLVPEDELDRSGMLMLSPYLVPYFTNQRLDQETEAIWNEYIPEALTDPDKRGAYALAEAMGLCIHYSPVPNHDTVHSILFLIEDTVQIQSEDPLDTELQSDHIAANTIVVNANLVQRDHSAFHIYHECIHYYEHYLFFRLQQLHNNDILQMKTKTVVVTADEKIINPVYWMEKQANRGAYGLMLPSTDTAARVSEVFPHITSYRHIGERYESLCNALAASLSLPAFRIRARLIQLGHVYAKGAVNYVDREKIYPFSFDAASLSAEEYTFVISPSIAGNLYEHNEAFRQILDTGKFIYADGHIVRNEARFIVDSAFGPKLSDWASAHVDQCCLRFVRQYEQKNAGQYVFGRMYYDADYVQQTTFYLGDLINARELDELDAREKYIASFPKSFKDAFIKLRMANGLNHQEAAELFHINSRTLDRWLYAPDSFITADFVMLTTLLFKLPDWISDLLFKRAHIQLDEDEKRHRAFRYIQRVLWMDGVDKANDFLRAKNLEPLKI